MAGKMPHLPKMSAPTKDELTAPIPAAEPLPDTPPAPTDADRIALLERKVAYIEKLNGHVET